MYNFIYLADVIMSVGLLIASFVIFFVGSDKGAKVSEYNNWHLFDPLSTYVFSIITVISTFPVAKNCYYLIMESTPSYIDIERLKNECG
jgi:Co/Zn/Cd efflux system component